MSAVPDGSNKLAQTLNEGLPSYKESVALNSLPASTAIISQPMPNEIRNKQEVEDIQYSSFCGDCSSCCTHTRNADSTSETLLCCLLCQICCDAQGDCCTALNECVGYCLIEMCAGVEGCCECVAACCEGCGVCCAAS